MYQPEGGRGRAGDGREGRGRGKKAQQTTTDRAAAAAATAALRGAQATEVATASALLSSDPLSCTPPEPLAVGPRLGDISGTVVASSMAPLSAMFPRMPTLPAALPVAPKSELAASTFPCQTAAEPSPGLQLTAAEIEMIAAGTFE